MSQQRYVIRGGREGYDRLRVLHLVHGPNTSELFDVIGLRPGMRCLDLGCGGGEVTFEMARRVAPGGTATGYDMDEVKLSLAREEGARRGLTNVTFRAGDVTTWSEPGTYDLVYCRLLLEHLKEPVELLRRMWEAVRPNGVVAAEDADFDGSFCDPPNAGHAFYARAVPLLIASNGGDPTLGRKLHRLFRDAGMPGPRVRLKQVLHLAGEEKTLPLLSLEATAEGMVSEGLARADEVRAAQEDLAAFTADPETIIGGPRVFQVWARRDGALSVQP